MPLTARSGSRRTLAASRSWNDGRALFAIVLGAALLASSVVGAQNQTPAAPAAGAAQATEDPEWFKDAVRPGSGVTNPVLVKSAKPAYTTEAMNAKVTGTVSLDARVDTDGRIRNVRVVRSIPMLDAEAEKAAKAFEFKPGMKNGEPVAVIVRIEIAFNLRANPAN